MVQATATQVKPSLYEEEAVVTTMTTVQDKGPYQAYRILQAGFAALPILAGLDKFFSILAAWGQYLAPRVAQFLPVGTTTFMHIVGGIEILAGLLVAVKPRVGAYVVAFWLWGIIANLLMVPGFYDIALRDFGLSLGALALARLSRVYDR